MKSIGTWSKVAINVETFVTAASVKQLTALIRLADRGKPDRKFSNVCCRLLRAVDADSPILR